MIIVCFVLQPHLHRDSPVSSNEEVSRSSWNNGRRPRTPPGDPPGPTGPRTPPMPATRGIPRTPEGPSPTGPRTPDGSGMRGARTPETPFDDRYVKPRDVKRPSTPPEPYPEVSKDIIH